MLCQMRQSNVFKMCLKIILLRGNSRHPFLISPMMCGFTYFTYILNTEFSDGVVHQDSEVLHCHPDVPVHPAAFLWPVLVAFILVRQSHQ